MHVWICLCKRVGTRMCMCVHMHVEDHGWCQIFFDYSLPDILKQWTQNLPIFLIQLATLPWAYAVSTSQLLGLQAGCHIWLLYGCRCGGSKLGPHTYVLSTVSTISPALLWTDLSWHASGTLTRTQLSTEWFWFVESNHTQTHLCMCIREAEVNNHGYLEILLVGFILKGTLLKVIQDGLQIIQHHLDFLLVSRNIQDLWVL